MEADLLSSLDRVGVRARTSGIGFVLTQKIKPTLCNPQPRGLVGIIGGVAYLFSRLARILLVLFALRHGRTPNAAQMQQPDTLRRRPKRPDLRSRNQPSSPPLR